MKKLSVYLTTTNQERRRVGELADVDHKIYFEYDTEFLNTPLWLSPFKLPPTPGLHEHRDRSFGPLFGVFDDSLPDGWGLLLMDRHFRKRRIPLDSLSPLDRLAHVGTRTMGALTYHPPESSETFDMNTFDLHDLAQEAYRVLKGTAADILPQLMLAGGSPGGTRPKVLVGVKDNQLLSGADDLPEGYSHWIVKFHSKQDAIHDGRIEYAYSNMARSAGIDMPKTQLFTTAEGDAFFGVQRFDRTPNQRIHIHTFGNLIHSNFRIPGCDYEDLLKTTRVLTKNQTDVVAAFRQMIFNILTHNRDDHVKNFAFMLNNSNEWRLTPAYDLTFSHGPGGEHTMTVAGEGRVPTHTDILRVATGAGISKPQANAIVDEIITAIASWPQFADQAGIPNQTTQTIRNAMPRIEKK